MDSILAEIYLQLLGTNYTEFSVQMLKYPLIQTLRTYLETFPSTNVTKVDCFYHETHLINELLDIVEQFKIRNLSIAGTLKDQVSDRLQNFNFLESLTISTNFYRYRQQIQFKSNLKYLHIMSS